MSILGLGNDIIEISRIEQSIQRLQSHFLDKLFTEKEQAYCNQHKQAATHYAGRFAAKEAIAKAFGLGFGEKISWKDIEILPDEFGKPIAFLSPKIKSQFNDPQILLSISHCNAYATAVAIWTRQ